MPIRAQLFDGTVLEFPDGTAQEVINRVAKEETLKRKPAPEPVVPFEPPKKEGLAAAVGKGLESLISPSRTAIGAVTGSAEEAAAAGLKRAQESPYAEQVSLEKVKQAYERGLLPAIGEVAGQIPYAIAEQIPNIAATLGGARLGAMAGAGLGSVVPGIGNVVGGIGGGILGALAPSLLQQFGGNIQRQAQEQMEAKQPLDISRTAAAAAALPQAGLDVAATFIPLGRNIAGSVLGPQVKQLLERGAKESAEKLARESLPAVLAKGAGISIASEAPTEALQSMLERAQAGLPLLSEDALKEYGEAAYQAALIAPIGSAARVGERAAARQQTRPPELLPGESERDAAIRLRDEIAALRQAEAPPPPGPVISTENLYNLIAQPNGYGLVEQYKQRLKALPEQTDEVKSAIEEATLIQNRYTTEELARKPTTAVLDEKKLKDLGFGPQEDAYKFLLGKDMASPDQADEMVDVLTAMRSAEGIKEAEIGKIDNFLVNLNAFQESIYPRGKDAGTTVAPPSGEGPSVVGKPDTGAPAEGAGVTQPSGVVPPVADVGKPPTGEAKPTAPVEAIPKTERDAVEQHAVRGMPIVEAPLDQITISKDVPQFKSEADEMGIVKPLEGKFERTGVAPIQLWRRTDGSLEVISGRHRFDLAKRSGETTIPAQIHDEASGFDAAKAATLDAELNIRDEQGEVKDYVVYFEKSGISEADAKSRGLLGRTVGQRGWAIASQGSPELIASHRAGVVPDDAAAGIANIAPKDARLQAVGIKAIQDNKSTPAALNTVQAVKALAVEKGVPQEQAGDLFGFDDSAIKEAENMAQIATEKQREIGARLSAITGAANKPAVAKAEGIDIKDEAALNKRIQELRQARAAWNNWSSNPDLVKEIRDAMTKPTAAPPIEPPAAPTAPLKTKIVKTEVETEGGKTKGAWNVVDASNDQIIDTFNTRKEAQDYVNKGKPNKKSLAEVPPTAWGEIERRAKAAREAAPAKEEPSAEEAARQQEINAKIEQLGKLLSRIMGRFGLKDVALKLIDDMKAEGEYSQNVIRLALDAVSPVQALRHESIHALKELGFFTPQQWKTLEQRAKDKWIDEYLKTKNINKEPLGEGEVSRYDAYMDLYKGDMDAIIEEAIADAFGDFDVNKAPPGLMQAILTRLRNFFDGIKAAFGGELTAEQIFKRVEKGEIKPEGLPVKADSWKADDTTEAQADAFEDEEGIRPYTSAGQLEVPVEMPKQSIKAPYAPKEIAKGKENHPIFGLPLNENGTITLYFPTSNQLAREVMKNKRLKSADPKANRIYLTNESSPIAIKDNLGNIDQGPVEANVMVHVTPDMLQLDAEYENGRKDFFIQLAEGQAFAEKMKATKLFTLYKPRAEAIAKTTTINDIADGFNKGIADYLALSPAERRQRLKQAREVLKSEHNVGTLLGENGKLQKTRLNEYQLPEDIENSVASLGLGLASAQKINEGNLSTCPKAARCEGLCLGETSGQNLLYGGDGPFRSGPRLSQYLKTEAMVMHPEDFSIVLFDEINRFKAWAQKDTGFENIKDESGEVVKTPKQVYTPAIRLNVTSDFPPKVFQSIIEAFPDVRFYDYTKLTSSNTIAPNHHLTYSSDGVAQVVNGTTVGLGANWNAVLKRLLEGKNVAMAFTSKTSMPEFLVDEATGERFQVWNGDNYDARFLDPKPGQKGNLFNKGMIIGLTNKDRTTKPEDAAIVHDGFFVQYDPAVDGNTVTVKDQKKLKDKKVIPIAKRFSIRAPNTREFQQFFSGSKAIDERGDPILYFRGTLRDEPVIRPRVADAIFFSPIPDFAEGYIDYKLKELAERPGEYLSAPQIRDAVKNLRQYVYDTYGRQNKAGKVFLDQIAEVEAEGKKTGVYKFKGELFDVWSGIGTQMGIVEQQLFTGRNVMPVYINAQNPFDFDNNNQVRRVVRRLARLPSVADKMQKEGIFKPEFTTFEQEEKAVRQYYLRKIKSGDWRTIESKEVQEAIRDIGYDGFYAAEEHTEGKVKNLAVYSSKQVKSAIGNVGAYGQRAIEEREAAPLGMTAAEAMEAQERGDIRFSLRDPLGLYSELENKVAQGPNKAPAASWKAYINGLTQKGVKPEEIEWSGVRDWLDLQTGPVSKDAVNAYLKQGGVKVEEVVLGGRQPWRERLDLLETRGVRNLNAAEREELNDLRDRFDREGPTPEPEKTQAKYGQYTLPGGENYREVLLTLPGKQDEAARNKRLTEISYEMSDSGTTPERYRELYEERSRLFSEYTASDEAKYKSSHWDQPNVIAHIRLNDRTDADGNKVLFVEEIQSDWGQEGKKKGFALTAAQRKALEPGSPEAIAALGRGALGDMRVDVQEQGFAPFQQTLRGPAFEGLPVAPFVTKTEGWLNLALKRVMVLAAEGGYDKVAFVNGEQSADRYDLSKQVRELLVDRIDDEEWSVRAFAKEGDEDRSIDRDITSLSELDDLVGKEVADRARIQIEQEGRARLRGLDLKVGGEGMKTFYDTIVPMTVKKLLPKVGGGQIGTVNINPGFEVFQIDENLWGNNVDERTFSSEKAARESAGMPQPGFDVTPDMKRKVETTGLPRFSLRGASWNDSRVETLLNKYSYLQNGREKDTKAYAAFVKPEDFLAATTPVSDRERLESEKTPLDVKRLAKEDQEIFLDIKPTEEEGVYQITGHEGRHRMMALRDAGINSVPVVFYTGGTKNAEIVEEPYFKSQEHRGDKRLIKSQRGFSAMEMIPINWEQRNNIKETFGGEAKVKFSLRSTVPFATHQRILQTTVARQEKGFVERIIDAISPQSFSNFRAQALNRYNQLGVYDRELAKKAGGAALLANSSAESAALLSDLGAGLTASALGVHDRMGGVPVYKNGITIISNKGGTIKGPTAIFAPLAKYGDPYAYQAYQYWAGVKRGSRFMADGREQLFEPADIQKAEDLRKRFLKDGVDFNAIQQEWIKFNDGLVDYMLDTGVLSKDRADLYKKHSDYLPFYRQMDGEETVGPRIFQAISGIKPPKKLKGGEAPIDDFLENIVRNVQSSIQMGVKNIAAKRAAEVATKLNKVTKLNYQSSNPLVFHVYENGKVVSYLSDDILFVNAIKSLGIPELPFIGMLSAPANVLRNLVTKDPAFMLANLMRDSMSAWVTSGVKMTPMVDTFRNFGSALAGKDPAFQALMNAGILGGYEFSQNVEQSGREFGKALRKQAGVRAPGMKGVLEFGTKPFTSLWEALEKGTTASDAATRMEVYKKTLAETGNEAEAIYRALEVMNFNRKGSSAVIRVLTAAVPFLNARMQGLDVLYRAATGQVVSADAKEIQKRFFVRGATIAALSCMYWMLTHDDDEYKKQEQETRDNYWLLPSLGIKIPIPFEIGVLFKVIPERILGYTMGSDTGEDFIKSMARQLTSTLAFNPIPQTALPIIEATANFSFFTMRPIVGQGMEGLQPAYQVGPGTSRLAEAVGDITKGLPKELQISPMKLDQIISGYTGTMGMYLVNVMDAVYDMHTDSPKPSRRFEQMPLIRRFALDPEARGNVTAYYELKNSVDSIVRTSNMLERTMNYKELPGYLQDNMRMLSSKDYILDLEKSLKEFREMKAMVRSAQMSADAKRAAVTSIERMENQLTSNIQYIKSLAKGR